MRCAGAARLLDRRDLLEHRLEAAGQERAAVDHHVDLVGAGLHGQPGVGQLDLERGAARGERRGDRGDPDPGALQLLLGHGGHVRVHAYRGGGGAVRVGRIGPARLEAERTHLAWGVRALQRRQVDHPDGQVDARGLGRGLYRPGAEPGGAGLEAHLVHAGQTEQEAAQRGFAAARPARVIGVVRPRRRDGAGHVLHSNPLSKRSPSGRSTSRDRPAPPLPNRRRACVDLRPPGGAESRS